MTNERCRLISESQWREYQEFKADKRVLDEQISNLQSVVESECSKRCELEQEYIDCLRDTRNQLTEQILQHLDEIDVLQKKLDIAVNCLNYIVANYSGRCIVDILKALKEIDLVGTSMSLADNKMQANTLADNKLQAKEEV